MTTDLRAWGSDPLREIINTIIFADPVDGLADAMGVGACGGHAPTELSAPLRAHARDRFAYERMLEVCLERVHRHADTFDDLCLSDDPATGGHRYYADERLECVLAMLLALNLRVAAAGRRESDARIRDAFLRAVGTDAHLIDGTPFALRHAIYHEMHVADEHFDYLE